MRSLHRTPHRHGLCLASLTMMDCHPLKLKWNKSFHPPLTSVRYLSCQLGSTSFSSYLRTISWRHICSFPASLKGSIPCHLSWLVVPVYYRRFLQMRGTVETLGTQTKRNWAGTGRRLWMRTIVLVTKAAFLSTASQEKGRYLKVSSRGFCFYISQNKAPVSSDRRQVLGLFEAFLKWLHGKQKLFALSKD